MYLLIGDCNDFLCSGVKASLERRGCETRCLGNPCFEPVHFALRIDTLTSSSQLIFEDGRELSDRQIDGVLVAKPVKLSPTRWNRNDLAYAQTEIDAALLAWLWSLSCPVINRYSAALWFRSDPPLLSWYTMLLQHGLRGLDSVITNVETEARHFSMPLCDRTVYTPLTSRSRYPLDSYEVWQKIGAILGATPINLTHEWIPRFAACVVGSRVVWNQAPPTEVPIIEKRFIHFVEAAGLAFCQIDITLTPDGVRVTNVDPCPRLELFSQSARLDIISELVKLLTGDLDPGFPGKVPRAAA
jgi:hypothetical protein